VPRSIAYEIAGIRVQEKEQPAMSSSRWDPWGEIVSLREAMNNLLEESFVRPRQGSAMPGMASSLALDVKETADHFVITASVPGVPSSDIDITVLGDTLRIQGQRKEEIEKEGEGGRWLLRERRFGAFERTVALPAAVNSEQAAADFKDGVLTITLPKAEIAMPKSIPVKGMAPSGGSVGGQATEVEVRSSTESG
jgi:HSP20 family protein